MIEVDGLASSSKPSRRHYVGQDGSHVMGRRFPFLLQWSSDPVPQLPWCISFLHLCWYMYRALINKCLSNIAGSDWPSHLRRMARLLGSMDDAGGTLVIAHLHHVHPDSVMVRLSICRCQYGNARANRHSSGRPVDIPNPCSAWYGGSQCSVSGNPLLSQERQADQRKFASFTKKYCLSEEDMAKIYISFVWLG